MIETHGYYRVQIIDRKFNNLFNFERSLKFISNVFMYGVWATDLVFYA